MKRTAVRIPCAEIELEGVLQYPDGGGPFPAVIICHPHPMYGGNLHNNVVGAVSRELVRRSFAALRFNFRGVGESGGVPGNGIAEQEDVKAAIDFVYSQRDIDIGKLGLAGYSFGGGVALPVAFNDKRIKAMALIAPAISLPAVIPNIGGQAMALIAAEITEKAWDMLRQYRMPKLLVAGSNDEFFPPALFEENFRAVPEPKHFIVIKGADHFWQGYETEVAEKVGEFFTRNLR